MPMDVKNMTAAAACLPPGFPSWRDLMQPALDQAFAAGARGEAPAGAAVFGPDGCVLGLAGNESVAANDPTAHAEVLALRRAGAAVGNYRLTGSILVATVEPCLMCLGALVHARVAGLVFGARDPKAGAVVSRLAASELSFLNHRFWVVEGVLAAECAAAMSRFFAARRKG
jgi:tRNA(adenine34) deaminase